MKKRALSLTLCLCLCLSLLPTVAGAEEPDLVARVTYPYGATSEYKDLQGCLDDMADFTGCTVQLLRDVTAPDEQTFTATGGEFTLDLNGYTLTGGKGKENAEEDPTLETNYELSQAAYGKTGLTIDGATVTLKNGAITGGTGGYYSRDDFDGNGGGGNGVTITSGALTVESGVTLTSGDPGSRYAALTRGLHALNIEGGTVTLNGGIYDSRTKTVGDAIQNGLIGIGVCGTEAYLTVPADADVTAMGEGGISIAIESGTVDIAGGSYTGEYYGLAIGSSELTATVQLSGGTYTATRTNGCAVNVFGSVTHAGLLAEGCHFADGDDNKVEDGDLATAKTLTVTQPSSPQPHTYTFDLDGGTWTVEQLVYPTSDDFRIPEPVPTKEGYVFCGWMEYIGENENGICWPGDLLGEPLEDHVLVAQ